MLFSVVQEELYKIHCEAYEEGRFCKHCKFKIKTGCTQPNVVNCPVVANQLNLLQLGLIGLNPLEDRGAWLRDDL